MRFLVAACLAAATLHAAEPTPRESLLVLSKADQTLAIVDPATRKIIARMPSGPDPHEVIASAGGELAFISNYGGGAYNTITIADLTAQRTIDTFDLGPLRGPHGLVFAGGKLWFTAETAKAIGSYDPATKKVDWVMGTGQNRTHMIHVFDDLKRIVTSNVGSASMTFIEKVNRPPGGPGGPGGPPRPPRPDEWEETVVAVGRGAEGFDLSPDGKELWAANALDGTISILNIAAKKVTQTLDVNVTGANRLKFTPDGKHAFVSTLRGPDLAIFSAATRKEVKRIPIGTGAAGIQMQPDGAIAYVACTPDNYVVVFDLKTLAAIGKFDAGKQPDGMAWAIRR